MKDCLELLVEKIVEALEAPAQDTRIDRAEAAMRDCVRTNALGADVGNRLIVALDDLHGHALGIGRVP